MDYLLGTQAFQWADAEPARLSAKARTAMADESLGPAIILQPWKRLLASHSRGRYAAHHASHVIHPDASREPLALIAARIATGVPVAQDVTVRFRCTG